MEHIHISPGKIKLMLTKSDLDKYELEDITRYGEDDYTKIAFRELLDDVKRDVGFDASSDKVLIQFFPSRDGGAEVYITRLGMRKDEPPKTDGAATVESVYAFSSMRELLSGCFGFSKTALYEKSSAWEDMGKYYLMVEEKILPRDLRKGREDRLRDMLPKHYGEFSSDVMRSYIREHCKCICEERAIDILSKLA